MSSELDAHPPTTVEHGASTNFNEFLDRNRRFADRSFPGFTPIAPSLKTIVVGCVDPRVEPAELLGIGTGEAVVIRNVGGRITPSFFQQMMMLRLVAQADGDNPGDGWNFIVLHHTDCGITRLGPHTDLLAQYFGVPLGALPACHIMDPRAAVEADIETLRTNPFFPSEFHVSGLVYDVATGLVDTVVGPERLRPD